MEEYMMRVDETVIFTDFTLMPALPRRPLPHSSNNRHGYEIPPRYRFRTNAFRDSLSYFFTETETESMISQTQVWHAFAHQETPARIDVSGISKECISEYLMSRIATCPRREEEVCTICQDDIHIEEEMTILGCTHVYHMRCIKNWLEVKNECAVCRAHVIPDNR